MVTYYSITFKDIDGSKPINTFEDFKLVPDSRPLIAPPSVKTEYVDVPGADGSLDYTEALSGIKFNDREGSWTFYVLNELYTGSNRYLRWNELYALILKTVHGRRKRIELESDPGYYYLGRVFLDQWNSQKDYSKIVLKYRVEPWKYPIDTTANYDWQWNELFGNTIFYGTFDVVNEKHRNLINPTEENITPTFTCTSGMTVTFGANTYSLPSGTSTPEFEIIPGDNFMVFNGNGRVVVDYSIGRSL